MIPDELATKRLRLVLVTPEDAEGMLAGRRRLSWHRDYPRAEDRDAASGPLQHLDVVATVADREHVGGGDPELVGDELQPGGLADAHRRQVEPGGPADAADAVTGTVHDEGAATELARWFPESRS